MLSRDLFIRQSLETHLFFARIMKEHAFFLQLGFTPRDKEFMDKADNLRIKFDDFLSGVVNISDRNISREVISSDEIVTPYTLDAEKKSIFYTGVMIPTGITKRELELEAGNPKEYDEKSEELISKLNQKGMALIKKIIEFKTDVLGKVTSCKMFTLNYPLLIEHILREAKLYLSIIDRLQKREKIDVNREIYGQELFWSRIMAEHSMFIRGLLDPTENDLINTANDFAMEFERLNEAVLDAIDKAAPIHMVTAEMLRATKNISGFNAQATQGLLQCQIMSIILPLLGDHVLRESNHFIRLLEKFRKI